MAILTIDDVFSQRLPTEIAIARNRAANLPALIQTCSPSAIRLLQILITFTSLDHLEELVQFTRTKPAQILGVSTRSISRFLGELEEQGWILRQAQQKYGPQRWGCLRLRWTEKALTLLFRIQRTPATPPPKDQKSSTQAERILQQVMASFDPQKIVDKMLKAHNTAKLKPPTAPEEASTPKEPTPASLFSPIVLPPIPSPKEQLSAEQEKDATPQRKEAPTPCATKWSGLCETFLADKPKINLSKDIAYETKEKQKNLVAQKAVRPCNRSIPEALHTFMLEFSLNERQMVFLMARCKQAGQRLQHMFSCVIDYLRSKKMLGEHVMRFLVFCLKSGRDFTWQHKQHAQAIKTTRKKDKHQQLLQRVADALKEQKNCTLPDGSLLLETKTTVARLHFPQQDHKNTEFGEPVQMLAMRLACQYPFWTKRLLKGALVEGITPLPSITQERFRSQNPDKEAALQHIQRLKKLLI